MCPASQSDVRMHRAVVIGAGVGGLCAAAALADRFDEVMVLERDHLPDGPQHRAGIPQGRHAHALLTGGLRAMEALLPGFGARLKQGGAVPYTVGLDGRFERPGFDPYPQRDLGFGGMAMSRPLLEWTVRTCVQQLRGVVVHDDRRVLEILASDDGMAVTGIRHEAPGGIITTLDADLVIDASGRATPTLAALEATGRPPPAETVIGLDIGYASAIFAKPANAPTDWKYLMHFPRAPQSSRGCIMFSIEGDRWLVSIGGRGEEKPPGDIDGFLDFTKGLRVATVHEALCDAQPEGEPMRMAFQSSSWRHFSRMDNFPRGLLPIGDAICRFNPVYGQGMSVAACEARVLRDLLAASDQNPLDGLASRFLPATDAIIDTPWAMSATPDLLYPQTVGERPADLMNILQYGATLTRLGAVDPAVHKLTSEVQHLLKPRSVLREPALAARVMEMMKAAA
ncbi:hypothetical protein WKW79_26435 [Variovorax robiniae]|uniref:FAD-binding domain-containing protein n=1 Tax=Variovorax robiniae TaxID=1836199 RepID=A0ABU8XEB0_9BURK